jgi:hypothetical protein
MKQNKIIVNLFTDSFPIIETITSKCLDETPLSEFLISEFERQEALMSVKVGTFIWKDQKIFRDWSF